MSTATQYELADLLEQAGAQPPRYGRGKWQCPNHTGSPSVSVDEAKGFFNCHHHGCNFHGGVGTLRKRLGIQREWLPRTEYIRQRKERQRAESQAQQLLERCRAERLTVFSELHDLVRMEQAANMTGPDCEAAWNSLATVYRQRPLLTAEAVLLSEGSIADRRRWLEADSMERERMIDSIVMAGGILDDAGRFIEVNA